VGGGNVGRCVQQTSDGGFIITGTYGGTIGIGFRDVWLLKTNSMGDTLWTEIFYGNEEEEGYMVRETLDGDYIVVGYISTPFEDVWLIKTDDNGDTIWTKTYGYPGWDFGKDVLQTMDGGYIVVAHAANQGIWLLKTDNNGDTLWTKNYYPYSEPYAVIETSDSGFVILGELSLSTTYVWLIKTDSEGDTLWTKTFGGNNYERGYSIQQTTDNGFIITGKIQGNYNDVWILKTNSSGEAIWTKTFSNANGDYGYSVKQTTDGGYIIAGSTYLNEKKMEVYLIKLESDIVGIDTDQENISHSFNISQNFPNPFNPTTKLKYSIPQSSNVVLKVFDILGNEIETLVNEEKPTGTYEINWYAEGLPSGVYFYQFQAGGFVETKKMVLLR
jgi:hypothetical protein